MFSDTVDPLIRCSGIPVVRVAEVAIDAFREAHVRRVTDYGPRAGLLDTSKTSSRLMPLYPEPPPEAATGAAPGADGTAALVVWLFQNGTTSLAKAVEGWTHLVRRALLPWLVSRFRYVLAVLVNPLWQHFMRGLARMLDSEVAKHCHQILRAWFSSLSRTGKRLDRPPSATKKASLHQPSSTLASTEYTAPKEQKGHLQTSEQPGTLVMSKHGVLAQSNTVPVNTTTWSASLCLSQSNATTAVTNTSSSPSHARHEHSHVEDATSINMGTPRRREPFAGNWSSVCLYPMALFLLDVTTTPDFPQTYCQLHFNNSSNAQNADFTS